MAKGTFKLLPYNVMSLRAKAVGGPEYIQRKSDTRW